MRHSHQITYVVGPRLETFAATAVPEISADHSHDYLAPLITRHQSIGPA